MAEKDQVRIYVDKTISTCKDCPFLDYDLEYTQYHCGGRRASSRSLSNKTLQLIFINSKNFAIPQNCPFKNQEGE